MKRRDGKGKGKGERESEKERGKGKVKRREGFTEQFEAGLQIKKLLIIILLELGKEVSRENRNNNFHFHQTR